MPQTFSNFGITFQYPDNWKLDEEEVRASQSSVTVMSPGGGFWTVALHPPKADVARIALAALEAMQQEYEGLEAEEVAETVSGHELRGYDLNFFYLDLTNTATIRCFEVNETTYTVFCEAEDREYGEIGKVFEAMTVSLLRGFAND